MNSTGLIIKREYLSRVKKNSFIIMTLLGPLLLAAIMIVPIWLATQEKSELRIEVIDESFLFKDLIPENENIRFDYPPVSVIPAQENFYNTNYDAILYIPHNVISGGNAVKIFYKTPLGFAAEEYIASTFSKMAYNVILLKNKVDIKTIKIAAQNSQIKVLSEKIKTDGKSEKQNSGTFIAIAIGAGVLIYMFIFMYGVQVMRGVMEEKSNRIVEVILSSVKPFQFMMGKIIGIALVGLTQFVIWCVLTFSIYSIGSATLLKNIDIKQVQQKEEVYSIGADLNYEKMKQIDKANVVTQVWNDLKLIDVKAITLAFLFYFLIGYFMYAALFAAVGAAVDNEADTQQFVLPITIPLILCFVVAQFVIQNPESNITYWLSIIPFTSPIVMMLRLPFGVPINELILSMSFLVAGFFITTWIAARIYKTGILLYGKKASWRELTKWLFYKQ